VNGPMSPRRAVAGGSAARPGWCANRLEQWPNRASCEEIASASPRGLCPNAFTAMHVTGYDYSEAQVREAFQRGLGVSFDQVVAEAHAYAASVR